MEQEEHVVDSALDTTDVEDNQESYEQDDSEAESDGAETETVERKPETPEQRVARLKRQLDREERKLNPESKESRKESSKETKEVDVDVTERLDRSDLRYEGVKDKGEQDIIIEYARYKNLDVLDAMNTPAIKAELKEYRAKAATPTPGRRTSTGIKDEVAYWAGQLEKGNRPPTADLRIKAREYLVKNKK